MAEDIPDIQMSKIIEDMCKKSETFKNFYTTEIPKLKGKQICWKYDPKLVADGFALHPDGETSKKYEIKLKMHPTELMRNSNYFLIAHEIEHLVQYEKGYPTIRLHRIILAVLSPHHAKIAALLNSIIFDFSVNAKLKEYGIEIPFICLKPPNGDKSPAYNLSYIFRYILFRRYSLLLDEGYKKKIQECLEKYNDKDLVTVGDKIFKIINCSKLVDTEGNINLDQVKPVIEEISANLKEFFSLPSKFKLTVTQYSCYIDIAPTEVF
ncbi:MAG: hypothetical protein NTV10_00245 [Methanoregula sp.]|nr:hypothetical protein [Methanoregula sp.]